MRRLVGLVGALSLLTGLTAVRAQQAAAPPMVPLAELREALPRIGYDLFTIDLASVPPGPVDRSYELAAGDTLNLRVWGELQLSFLLTVTDDLFVEIPDVPGRVYVSGLNLTEVTDRLRRHLATAYATYFNLDNPAASQAFVDVALGSVRDVRFLVQGEVASPGSYTLHPSLANVIYAIARAGGLKESASLRSVRVRRGTQVIELDFYDFLLRGTVGQDQLRLRHGDIVFVPLKRREVAVRGEVRRPGYYTLRDDGAEDLAGVLDLAGGVRQTANTERILIRRTEVNRGAQTLSVNLTASGSTRLRDGDVVTVAASNSLRRDFVELQGAGVMVPGEYQFMPGMTLADLLASAGGLLPDAYLARAELRRTGPDQRRRYQSVDLRLVQQRDPAHNLAVEPLDVLTVFRVADIEGLDGVVTLSGHVKQPGEAPLSSGMRVSDLLFARAGVLDAAFMRDAYLPRAEISRVVSGSTARQLMAFDLGRLLAGDATQDQALQPGDDVRIFHRRDIVGAQRLVTMTGYTKAPGPQPLQAGMRLRDLLEGPGGYLDPDFRRGAYLPRGDLWRSVSRDNRVERELLRFDLGAVLRGDAGQNLALESGDEVVLYAAKDFLEPQLVDIGGAVNKPGQYELAANMTVGDLIVRAGGLKEMADPAVGDLFRVGVGADGRVALESSEISLADAGVTLRNRDRLQVRTRAGYQPSRVVSVTGQVQFPGEYSMNAAGRVSDLIRMAGGLLDDAFAEGADLRRGEGDAARVVFDLERALAQTNAPDNLLLEDGDRLTIPRRTNTVTVVDAVEHPITIAHKPGEGVKYYLQAAGGLTAEADPDAVQVVWPSGRVAPGRFLRGPDVRPGSTIRVSPRPSPYQRLADAATAGTTPAAPAAAAPAPEAEAAKAMATVAQGPLQAPVGPCPTVAFDLGSLRVTTVEATTYIGVTCDTLKPGDVVTVSFVRVNERVVVATEIKK